MNQASTHTSLNGSRLVRFLSELSVADIEVSHKHFTERLGQLIDLSDSVALSAAHGKLSALTAIPDTDKPVSAEAVIAEFLAVREAVVQFIINSFVVGSGAGWLSLPVVKADAPVAEAPGYEPYQLFYGTHQREMAFKVKKLRSNTRATVAGQSSTLAQLVALDTAMDVTLAAHTHKLFAGVPKLLATRFQHLYQQHRQGVTERQLDDDPQQWAEPGGWLGQFTAEMQGLLLAELEVRLQPVVGLIEALNEEIERN